MADAFPLVTVRAWQIDERSKEKGEIRAVSRVPKTSKKYNPPLVYQLLPHTMAPYVSEALTTHIALGVVTAECLAQLCSISVRKVALSYEKLLV
jgi:hypothetical protein